MTDRLTLKDMEDLAADLRERVTRGPSWLYKVPGHTFESQIVASRTEAEITKRRDLKAERYREHTRNLLHMLEMQIYQLKKGEQPCAK